MKTDTYLTIANISEGIYKEKGSKFFAIAIPVSSENEIKEHVQRIKKEYFDARHHCYAYILGLNKEKYRENDDGEPSGAAGKPIRGQLLSKNITNVLVIVVRYFGGTKLGVGGLITAYKTAAKDALDNAQIIEKTMMQKLIIKFDYAQMNEVMSIIKDENLEQLSHKFENDCEITISVRISDIDRIKILFKNFIIL